MITKVHINAITDMEHSDGKDSLCSRYVREVRSRTTHHRNSNIWVSSRSSHVNGENDNSRKRKIAEANAFKYFANT